MKMRLWKKGALDDGSIHCLGNGQMCVYEQGPNIIQVFGPPYSSPSAMMLSIQNNGIEVKSRREFGTAIWIHEIFIDGIYSGEMMDFVDSEIACMIRKINVNRNLIFELSTARDTSAVNNINRFEEPCISGGRLITTRAGAYIYHKYPGALQLSYEVITKGNTRIIETEEVRSLKVLCEPGESFIYFVGGPDYPACMDNCDNILKTEYKALLERTQKWWMDFKLRRTEVENNLGDNFSGRDKLLMTIDDVAVMIKTQQGIDGGVLAGYNYHLSYVRDQYGVSRCLLKLGYLEEAKAILNFYWKIWKEYGRIHNAQGSGVKGVFHVHENDEVEITGYLIIQAFDYYERSSDTKFLYEIMPMLEWAFKVQKSNLIKAMLPFNGDETYIAGGVLPRSTLYHGSAEATLLFVIGGEKLLSYMKEIDGWSKNELSENYAILEKVKSKYHRNFWDNGRLKTNNPERIIGIELPKYRHGICEACERYGFTESAFGWTERTANNRYLCPECFGIKELEQAQNTIYYLKSVSLTPLYYGSTILPRPELEAIINDIIEEYSKTGKLPSRPEGNISVGYDFGLLLYSFTELKHPMAKEIFEKTISIIDQTGVWVEYYENDRPMGTRCRPWESGINMEAIINYIQANCN